MSSFSFFFFCFSSFGKTKYMDKANYTIGMNIAPYYT